METELTIRAARDNDAEAIYLLNKYAFGYDYPLEKTRIRLHTILTTKRDKIYVALLNSRVVGYVHSSDYECIYNESLKNILALAVDEAQRGRGIGRALLQTVENWAKEDGSSGVRLVSGFNRHDAHNFYLSCGYTHRKDQKNFIKLFDQ